MNTLGRHLLVEYHGCDGRVLNDLIRIEAMMRLAAERAGAHIVASTFHPFSPQGVSGVVVVEESHLSIHTWPEVGYAAVDFYTCGDCVPEQAHEVLRQGLKAQHAEVMFVTRGQSSPGPSLSVSTHFEEGDAAGHYSGVEASLGGE